MKGLTKDTYTTKLPIPGFCFKSFRNGKQKKKKKKLDEIQDLECILSPHFVNTAFIFNRSRLGWKNSEQKRNLVRNKTSSDMNLEQLVEMLSSHRFPP